MSLLFEVTELDFKLNVENSSFLDETWTIPVSELVHVSSATVPQVSALFCHMLLHLCGTAHVTHLSTYLSLTHSSQVYLSVSLPPIKTLDMIVG